MHNILHHYKQNKKFFEQIAKEQIFFKYNIEIEPITSGDANFTAVLYNATITEDDNVFYLFAKVATMGEAVRTNAVNVYEIESMAYTKILKAFDRLQDEHKVPQEHRLTFSKFYGYNATVYEETLVLQNLVKDGYQAYNRHKSIDWQYAKSALRAMANMHALSFAYGEYYSDEFNDIIQDLKDGTVDITIVDLQTIQGNYPVMDLLYFIVTGSDEEFRKNYYQKSLDNYYTELSATMKRLHLDPDKIYSREDFDRDLKEKLPYGLIMAATTLPIATVDTEAAPQVKDDSDLSVFFVHSTSALFVERINGIVKDYVRWGILH